MFAQLCSLALYRTAAYIGMRFTRYLVKNMKTLCKETASKINDPTGCSFRGRGRHSRLTVHTVSRIPFHCARAAAASGRESG